MYNTFLWISSHPFHNLPRITWVDLPTFIHALLSRKFKGFILNARNFVSRFHREDILATLLSQLESGGPTASGGVKCVPSYVAPDLASAIRRHIAQSLRQRKGSPPFPCHYLAEWATYSLPPEIGDLPPATQEQLYTELLDKDALKELEDGGNVNWSEEVRFHSFSA